MTSCLEVNIDCTCLENFEFMYNFHFCTFITCLNLAGLLNSLILYNCGNKGGVTNLLFDVAVEV